MRPEAPWLLSPHANTHAGRNAWSLCWLQHVLSRCNGDKGLAACIAPGNPLCDMSLWGYFLRRTIGWFAFLLRLEEKCMHGHAWHCNLNSKGSAYWHITCAYCQDIIWPHFQSLKEPPSCFTNAWWLQTYYCASWSMRAGGCSSSYHTIIICWHGLQMHAD